MRLGFHLGPFSLSSGGRRRRRTRYWTHPGCTMHHRSQEAANKCGARAAAPPPVLRRASSTQTVPQPPSRTSQPSLLAQVNAASRPAKRKRHLTTVGWAVGRARTKKQAEDSSAIYLAAVAAVGTKQQSIDHLRAVPVAPSAGICAAGPCQRQREPGSSFCPIHGPKGAKKKRS